MIVLFTKLDINRLIGLIYLILLNGIDSFCKYHTHLRKPKKCQKFYMQKKVCLFFVTTNNIQLWSRYNRCYHFLWHIYSIDRAAFVHAHSIIKSHDQFLYLWCSFGFYWFSLLFNKFQRFISSFQKHQLRHEMSTGTEH